MVATGNLLVGQSGGATAVINASLCGVVERALASDEVGDIIGMRGGIAGLLSGDLIDLRRQAPDVWPLLSRTPSAALGSGRFKPTGDDLDRALAEIQRRHVRFLLYIGGNDSADTAHRLHLAARSVGYDLRVFSIPKTIDNDLPFTDHCPGYGSIARFLALATRDAGRDTEAMAGVHPVKVIEVMGRNAGWVAASCALARDDERDAPQLIYLPERPPASLQTVLTDVGDTHRRLGYCVLVVPETLRTADGRPLGGGEMPYVDAFGHPYNPGVSARLADAISGELGLRARYDKPGTIARMSMAMVSTTDLAEAEAVGREAVTRVLRGESDQMVTIERVAGEPYAVRYGAAPLEGIANTERCLPDEFIEPDGRSVTEAFRQYARPLLGAPIPPYARLAACPFPAH